jgi:hypothetical protein
MKTRLLTAATMLGMVLIVSGCNTPPRNERNVEIGHDNVSTPSADADPTRGPARKVPQPGDQGPSNTATVPNPTQENTGANATTTQDRWNSAPPNNTVPSAAPPNQQ